MSRLRGQPGATATIRSGIQPGQLPSQTGATPERKALVSDNAEGEAGKDWRQGRSSLAVRYLSDGRSGHPEIRRRRIQDHPSPNLAARASADMTMAASARRGIAQDPMGRCVRTCANSAEGCLRWLLLGRKRLQRGVVMAKPTLTTSAVVPTMEENLPVMVAGWANRGSRSRTDGVFLGYQRWLSVPRHSVGRLSLPNA